MEAQNPLQTAWSARLVADLLGTTPESAASSTKRWSLWNPSPILADRERKVCSAPGSPAFP
jgi:hypothetical protein